MPVILSARGWIPGLRVLLRDASHPAAAAAPLHQPVTCREEDLTVPARWSYREEGGSLTPQVEVLGVTEQCGPASLF